MKKFKMPKGATIIPKLEELDPKTSFIFTAVAHLKTVKEIKQFMHEYEEWMKLNAEGTAKKNPVATARGNIGYILGYFEDKKARKWYKTLNEVSHPVFGPSFGR